MVLFLPSDGGGAGSGVEEVPLGRASSGGPGSSSLGLDVLSGLLLLPPRNPRTGWLVDRGCTVSTRTDSANGVWVLGRVRRGRPQNEQPHYRVGLLVGIHVRGRPGYPIEGACGLGRAG